jgi:hypothetical protein
MSFKGCGPHSGGPNDVYLTPRWCVDRLIDAWVPSIAVATGEKVCLEPCVGSGNIVRAFNRQYAAARWEAWDISLDSTKLKNCGANTFWHGDFICADSEAGPPFYDMADHVGLVLTNPPYTLAQQFVRRARHWCPNADLMFLLRLGFLASEKRVKFYAEMGTPDIYVLPNRPSFTGDGRTDGADYGWFHWRAGEHREIGRLHILGLTPEEERNAR